MQTLEEAFECYEKECECGNSGDTEGRNCAHHVSNALIEAGFNDVECLSGCYCCSSGRPMRAKELYKWFKKNFTLQDGVPKEDGVYLVFQLRKRDGQAHVLLKKIGKDAGVKEQEDYGSESDWVEEYYA